MGAQQFPRGRPQALWTARRPVDDGGGTVGAGQAGRGQAGRGQAEAAAALVEPEVPLEDVAVLAGAGVLDELEESLEDVAESDDFAPESADLPFVLARLSLR